MTTGSRATIDHVLGTPKAALRRVVTRVLHLVPLRLLLRLRDAYAGGLGSAGRGLRRPLVRWLLELVRHRGIPGETFAVVDTPEVRFARADSLVLQRVFWLGRDGWEPELSRWWPELCRRATSVLEVGANVGYYTVFGARVAAGTYRAIEPHPYAASALRRNLELNGLGSVEVVEAAAVSDERAEVVELLVPEFDHFAAPAGTLVAAASEIDRRGTARITVPALAFSSTLRGVDLLKLDVEGQEYELLHAAEDHLRRHRPTICVEVLDGTPRLRAFLVELCRSTGHRCLVPTRERLLQVAVDDLADVALGKHFGVRDVILTCDDGLG